MKIAYSIESNPLDDNGSSPWLIFNDDCNDSRGGLRAFASDEDLDRLGTTQDERDEARRGYEIACETIAVDTLSDIFEMHGY